jgi:hypothetical protein
MWRRLLYFCVLLAGGLAILSIVVGPENLFDTSPVEEDPLSVRPVGEVRVEAQKQGPAGAGRGTPRSVGIQIEGEIQDLRREYQVELPSGEKRLLLLYRLSSRDVEPSNVDRSYLLRDVRVWFYRRVGTGNDVRSIPVVRLDAGQMTAFLKDDGGALRIDETQDLIARDIEIFASPAGLLEEESAVPERLDPSDIRLELRAARMRSQIGQERIQLRSELEDGPMSIVVDSARMPIEIEGRGFVADLPVDLEEGVARQNESALPSRITLMRDVRVRGLGPAGAEGAGPRSPWTVRGQGPLYLDESPAGGLALQLQGDVEMRGVAELGDSSTAGDQSVVLRGERLHAWLGRGQLPGRKESNVLIAPALRDLRIEAGESPAELQRSEGLVRAQQMEVALDPFGRLARVDAIGDPEIQLELQSGFGMGAPAEDPPFAAEQVWIRCEDRISWLRGTQATGWMLEPLGFASFGPALAFTSSYAPDEILRFHGATEIVPDRPLRGLRRVRSERGLLVLARRVHGGLELSEVHGFGAVAGEFVRENARAGAARSGSSRAGSGQAGSQGKPEQQIGFRGDDGFFVRRRPLSDRVDFLLGRPGESGPAQRRPVALLLRSEEFSVSGIGRLAGHVRLGFADALRPQSGALRFDATQGASLDVRRVSERQPFDIEGVESVALFLDQQEIVRQSYRGDGLTLSGPDLRAIGDRLDRRGHGPWVLQRDAERVELTYRSLEGVAELRGRRVTVWPQPRPWPLGEGRDVTLLAEDDVSVRWEDPLVGRRVELDAQRLRYSPSLAPSLERPLLAAGIGPGGTLLLEALRGGEDPRQPQRSAGLWRADGDVRFAMSEDRGKLGVAQREFRGERVWALGGGRATRIWPKQGELVKGFVDEPGTLRCDVEVELLATQGASFELGGDAPKVWVLDRRTTQGKRLLLEPSGRISFEENVLLLPGPVHIATQELRAMESSRASEATPGSDRIAGSQDPADPSGLDLRSGGDIRIVFDADALRAQAEPASSSKKPEARPVANGLFGLPPEIESISAEGGVEIRRGSLFAICSTLRFDSRSGWAQMHSVGREAVRAYLGDWLLVDAWPGIDLHLETLEMRGGSGRLFQSARSAPSAGESRR